MAACSGERDHTLTAYLRNVLQRIADHPINRIDKLLPWNVAAKLTPMPLAA